MYYNRFEPNKSVNFSTLMGKTIIKMHGKIGDSEIFFSDSNGTHYVMLHYQDCCEEVYLESVDGNIHSLLNSPIVMAECVKKDEGCQSEWTFYKLATANGYVTLRWYGTTDSCYSLEVDFATMCKRKDT